MNSQEIISYLQTLGGSNLGIENFKNFMNKLGNPQNNFKSIQVLGTNGKGSTTNFLCDLLEKKYHKVGSFTSPALINVYDRIKINHQDICEDDFNRIFHSIYEDSLQYQLGFFEVICAICFIYFSEQKVDYAVIEAGLGGLHDCTSIIKPEVRLLTNIGLDHVNVLGNTLEEICLQKVGALKSGETLLCSVENTDLQTIITQYCNENNNHVSFIDSTEFNYKIGMHGDFQKKNAALALATIKYLNIKLETKELEQVFLQSNWHGRFEKITNNFYIDGAHNEMGIKAAITSANNVFGIGNYHIVFSALKDKELKKMYQLLSVASNDVVLTTFDFFRAYSTEELSNLGLTYNTDFKYLIDKALKSKENYLFLGSLYFVTDIIKYLKSVGKYNV